MGVVVGYRVLQHQGIYTYQITLPAVVAPAAVINDQVLGDEKNYGATAKNADDLGAARQGKAVQPRRSGDFSGFALRRTP